MSLHVLARISTLLTWICAFLYRWPRKHLEKAGERGSGIGAAVGCWMLGEAGATDATPLTNSGPAVAFSNITSPSSPLQWKSSGRTLAGWSPNVEMHGSIRCVRLYYDQSRTCCTLRERQSHTTDVNYLHRACHLARPSPCVLIDRSQARVSLPTLARNLPISVSSRMSEPRQLRSFELRSAQPPSAQASQGHGRALSRYRLSSTSFSPLSRLHSSHHPAQRTTQFSWRATSRALTRKSKVRLVLTRLPPA